jgi:hypothetical protein
MGVRRFLGERGMTFAPLAPGGVGFCQLGRRRPWHGRNARESENRTSQGSNTSTGWRRCWSGCAQWAANGIGPAIGNCTSISPGKGIRNLLDVSLEGGLWFRGRVGARLDRSIVHLRTGGRAGHCGERPAIPLLSAAGSRDQSKGGKGDAALFGPQLERLRSQEIIGRHLPRLSARTWNCGKHDRGAVIARGVAFGEERWAGESPIA